MTGDIHSGVQDISEPKTDIKILKKNEDVSKDNFLAPATANSVDHNAQVTTLNTQISSLSTQISTASNASDGSLGCEICNIRVTSAKILQRHLEGRKHKSRAERKGKTFHCDLCDVTANSEIQLNIHLSSSKHKLRVVREENKEFFDVSSYSKSMYVLLFAILCIIVNMVILVKVAM